MLTEPFRMGLVHFVLDAVARVYLSTVTIPVQVLKTSFRPSLIMGLCSGSMLEVSFCAHSRYLQVQHTKPSSAAKASFRASYLDCILLCLLQTPYLLPWIHISGEPLEKLRNGNRAVMLRARIQQLKTRVFCHVHAELFNTL